ncbi:hypothetical protein [Polaribacter porphyrae]|uniref:PLAT domain-containing protein n=1 Tax=Polaribacter porphyrae TaxID=1137780 RepID=A0A2S7WPG3_9FLAO|nr:hypothetical protein [Polaribacter porphyrae]PQJ79474.1 hypothetical protein BTO18_09955 [Polaribacter porphyrae]
MKKIILITILSVFSLGFASTNHINDYNSKIEKINIVNKYNKVDEKKDCTVRLNFTLEDGTKIEGEITFLDVTWWQCTKMQLAAWWERNF